MENPFIKKGIEYRKFRLKQPLSVKGSTGRMLPGTDWIIWKGQPGSFNKCAWQGNLGSGSPRFYSNFTLPENYPLTETEWKEDR